MWERWEDVEVAEGSVILHESDLKIGWLGFLVILECLGRFEEEKGPWDGALDGGWILGERKTIQGDTKHFSG